MKKLFALILSCCLVFSSNIGVFADNIEYLETTENQNEKKYRRKVVLLHMYRFPIRMLKRII